MRNYVKIEKKSLLYNYYAYIDTEDFLADSIFIQEKLRVFFGKTGRKQDSQYVVVLCKGAPSGARFQQVQVLNPPGSGKDIAESKGVHREVESEGSWMWGTN